MDVADFLSRIDAQGNMRHIPTGHSRGSMLDFSTNDYLGLAMRDDLRQQFIGSLAGNGSLFTSSASRLLASEQEEYYSMEKLLESLYGRPALLFNSGYHANTGLIPALCDKSTLILADKLVHASIIDGIKLSNSEFSRFRHNDIRHLRRLIEKLRPSGDNIIVVVESVYSMDGDTAPLDDLARLKQDYPGITLYIDEAHSLGVNGVRGLGSVADTPLAPYFDVIIGTLGKAAASMGAFTVLSEELKLLAINRARSFIFSTALPPVNAAWSELMLRTIVEMQPEREHLKTLGIRLATGLASITGRDVAPSHIQPFIVGDAHRAVELSRRLLDNGIKVLPIRTPTVPPGTERLRISLSAAMSPDDIDVLINSLSSL